MRKISTAELRRREVINLCNGESLGYPCDFEIDADGGRILSLIVSPSNERLSLWGGREEYVIDWCRIECIGEDTVLVRIQPSDICCRGGEKRKRGWL